MQVFYRLFVEVPLSTLSHPTLNYAKKRWIPAGPIAKINWLMYLYLWTQLGAFIYLFIYLFIFWTCWTIQLIVRDDVSFISLQGL